MSHRSYSVFELLQYCQLYVSCNFFYVNQTFLTDFLESFDFVSIEIFCLSLNLQFIIIIIIIIVALILRINQNSIALVKML